MTPEAQLEAAYRRVSDAWRKAADGLCPSCGPDTGRPLCAVCQYCLDSMINRELAARIEEEQAATTPTPAR